MADYSDFTTAAQAVADPSTNALDLAQIAQFQPSLREQVAGHPNVYQDLVDWLAAKGVVRPAPVVPSVQVASVVQPAPVAEPAPVVQPAPVMQPAPIMQAAPVAEAVPVAESAPVAFAAPVVEQPSMPQQSAFNWVYQQPDAPVAVPPLAPSDVPAAPSPIVQPFVEPQPAVPLTVDQPAASDPSVAPELPSYPPATYQPATPLDGGQQMAPMPTQPVPVLPMQPMSTSAKKSSSPGVGIGMIVGAVAVFVICSIIQGAAGSSMFTQSFYSTGNALLDTLVSISWWPGWIASVGLLIGGIANLVRTK